LHFCSPGDGDVNVPNLRISLLFLLPFALSCRRPEGSIRQISDSGAGAYEASLAVLPEGFASAWYDLRDGNPEIYFRLLDSEGKPQSPEFRVTRDRELSYEPDIAVAGENIVIGWYDKSVDSDTLRAKLGVWSKKAEPRWIKTVSAANARGRNTVVRAKGREVFCAWIEEADSGATEVWAGWWSIDGEPIAPPRRLAPAGKTTWNLNAAIDDSGAAWVVMDAKAGTRNNELFLVRVTKEEARVVRLTTDDGISTKYPDLGFSGDRAALTWFDERDGNQEVYLFVGLMNRLYEGLEKHSQRVTDTPGDSIGAYLAWNGRRLGLAWCDNTEGQHEIYFQSFDADGKPLNPARRLTHNETDSLIPAIRPAREGFALVWNEYSPESQDAHSGGPSEIMFTLVQ
jgi:hypothetical protein